MVLRRAEGARLRNRSHQKEAGRVWECAPNRSPRGRLCIHLPPHQTDFRNHKSMRHIRDTGNFRNVFGVFFFAFSFFFFLKINIHSSFALITKIEFLNASNIQISLVHTHSRKAEVHAATGSGRRRPGPGPQGTPGGTGGLEMRY